MLDGVEENDIADWLLFAGGAIKKAKQMAVIERPRREPP